MQFELSETSIFMKNLIITSVFCLLVTAAFTQTKKPAATVTPTVYTVSFGGYKNANITADQFKRVLDSALIVRDDKGNSYPIARFRINYTFATSFTDSETQQAKNFKDFRAADFYDTNKITEVWRSSLKDNSKKGDEVIFNNIIIKLKNGKKLMVNEWRGKLN